MSERFRKRHERMMEESAEYRQGYEEASAELADGTETLDCGCVRTVKTKRIIFGPVDCKEHGDE